MADERAAYLQWFEAKKTGPDAALQPQAAQSAPAQSFQQYFAERDAMASERAALMMEQAVPAGDAAAALGRSKEAEQQGLAIPPDLLTNATSELTRRIEAQTRRTQLMSSSRLSGWIVQDPINAALAQGDLQNLSGIAELLEGAKKGVDRAATMWWYGRRAKKAEDSLIDLQDRTADRGRTFSEIFADVRSRMIPEGYDAEQGVEPSEVVMRAPAKALARYLSSRITFVSDEALAQQEVLLVDAFDAAIRDRDTNAKRVDGTYGTSARTARANTAFADIGEIKDLGEQLSAIAAYAASDPSAVVSWLARVLVESAPSLAASAAVTAITRSPAAGAAAMGLFSYSVSEATTFEQFVREAGYDLSDPAQRAALISDPVLRRSMRDRAFAYGAVVGLMDAASGGVAGKTLARSPAGNMLLEALAQGAMGGGGEWLGALASGQDTNMVEVLAEVFAEFVAAPLEVAGVGGRYLREQQAVGQDRAFFEALAASAEDSKLRASVPERYRSAIDALTKDGPVENLYVDAQALDELFQSDPSGVTAEQFLSALPGADVEAFRRALDNGGVIEIPTASYASDIVGTRFDEILRQHLRTSPDRMSAAELKVYQEQLADLTQQAQTAVDKAASGQTELERVADDARVELVSSLRRAGRTNDVAEKEALQAVAFARTTAQRLGIGLDEFLKRYPLADVQGALESTVEVGVPRVTAEVMARVRAPVDQREGEGDLIAAMRAAAEAADLDVNVAEPRDLERAVEQMYGPAAGPVLMNQLGAQASPPARLDDLAAGVTPDFLRRPGWGVVTAARGTEADAEQNAALETELQRRGIAYRKMEGVYKGKSDGASFMIFADRDTVVELGRAFGQESVLTRDGLVFMDGSPTVPLAPDDLVTGDAAKARDFYSTMDDGTVWSAGFAQSLMQGREDVRKGDLAGDGRHFTNFFADVTAGVRQQPQRLDTYVPIIDLPQEVKTFAEERKPFSGNFEDHIQTSIPGYREMQDAVGYVIAETLGKGALLDIGASEGAMAKAAVQRNPGAIAVALDPNVSMRTTFESKPQVEGVRFDLSAFGSAEDAGQVAWTEDDGTDIPYFDPKGQKFDIVHEAMVFQFISNRRGAQVRRAKELMTPDGVFLTFEKFGGPAEEYRANEYKKDQYKSQYYDQETLAAKAAEVLQTGGDAIEGMTALQVSIAEMEQVLLDNFRHVFQIWDSGNFKGFAASDSYYDVNKFVQKLPSLKSAYATSKTPRRVWEARDDSEKPKVPVNKDGTVTLTHWSDEVRVTLDPAFAGTGPLNGDERNRRGPGKVFFGVNVGKPGGYRKEGLGPYRHEVRVPTKALYDLTRDASGLVDAIPDDVPSLQRIDWVEEKIAELGYKGYVVMDAPSGASAALFEAVDPISVRDDRTLELFQSGATPDFFSALTRDVANAKQVKASAKDWKSIIQRLPGIKKAEIEWSGVMDWLDAQEGQIAREVVADFLRRNEVTIETVVLTEDGGREIEVELGESEVVEPDEDFIAGEARDIYLGDLVLAKFDELNEDAKGGLEITTVAELKQAYPDVYDELVEQAETMARESYYDDPEYSYDARVTLPDGTDEYAYVRYANGQYEFEGDTYHREGVVEAVRDYFSTKYNDMTLTGKSKWEEYTEEGGRDYQEVLLTVPNLHENGLNQGLRAQPFRKASHFDQENIVVHARMNYRKDADGGKVLFVEEVQSDLGSFWRDKGGAPPIEMLRVRSRIQQQREEKYNELRAVREARDLAAEVALTGYDTTVERSDGTRQDGQHRIGGGSYLLRIALWTREGDLRGRGGGVSLRGMDAVVARLVDEMPRPGQDGYEKIAEWARLDNRHDMLDREHDELTRAANNVAGIDEPITPFEGEAYYALMMKKLLKVAAEEGAQKLAWTPAYMQARRWSGAVRNVLTEVTWGATTETSRADDTAMRYALEEFNQQWDRVRGLLRARAGEFGALNAVTYTDETSAEYAEFARASRGGMDPSAWGYTGVEAEQARAFDKAYVAMSGEPEFVELNKLEERASAEASAYKSAGAKVFALKMVELTGVNGGDTMYVDGEGIIRRASGGRIPADEVVGKPLSDLIGGTMARRVLEEPEGTISGQNIVVGGDGYKISYDQQIKRFVDKFARKYGSQVVVDTTLPDFARRTVADTTSKAVEQYGYANMMARLRESGLRDASFWEQLDVRVAERVQRAKESEASDLAWAKTNAEEVQRDYDRRLGIPGFADSVFAGDARARIKAYQDEVSRAQSALEELDTAERRAEVEYGVLRGVYDAVTDRQVIAALPEEARPVAEGEAVWSVEITPEMRAAASEAQPLFQKRPDGARGSILLPTEPGRAPLVTLFPKADLSTFLHESGHYYLHVLQDLVTKGEAPAGMQEDWDAIKNWWGQNIEGVAKDGGVSQEQVMSHLRDGTTGDLDVDRKVNVGLQETWARAYEAYLLEGKAPSNALRSAFEAFSAWLLSVYRRARGLNIEISDEMRGVFDRLLATDEEIAGAAKENGFDKLVAQNAAQLGVEEEEYQKLVRLSAEAQDEARQMMLFSIMAPIRRARTAEYRAERAEVEKEITATVNAKPANRVREWLGNARWLDGDAPEDLSGDLRLDRQMLIDEYGEDMVAALPRGRTPLWKTGTGLSADDVAGWFGYGSGSEMLQDVVSAPRAEAEIRSRVDAEMRKRYSDPLTDGTVEAQAVAALHGEKRGQLIAAELRAIGKVAKVGKVTTRSQAAEIARATIRQMPVYKAVRSNTYLAAERRASERAAQAVARGAMDEAYAAKREQLLNYQLYVESKAADEVLAKVESRVAKLKKKSVRENLAGEYLEAIDDILTSYDFRKSVSQRQAQRRSGLLKYVEMMKAAGRENELAIPAYVLDEAKRRPYKTLPVAELEGVLDSLRNIEHTARMKKKLRDAQSERDLALVVDGVTQAMDANLKDGAANRVATAGEKLRGGVREFANLLLNADTILRKIDGFDRGKAYDAIKAPIDAAADVAAVAREEAARALEALYVVYPKRAQRQMAVRKHYKELGGAFTKWDLISAALNTGNADNLARLMDKDSGGGFNAAQVEFIKQQLDKRDWDFVQSVWDYVNTFWPQIEARERRLTGVAPKKVLAAEVETPVGTYAGGYYPIKYRGDVSGLVAADDLVEVQKQMMAGRFGKAQTRHGHLEERARGSGGRVLQLGMEVLHQHVGRVIHDLSFSEAVANSWRILQDVRVRGAFERKGLLKDHQALEMWVQDTATGQIAAGGVFGRLALRAKNGFTLSKLAFNLSTVAIQLTGITQSIVVVGAQDMAVGYSTYLSNPVRTSKEVVGFSAFMRERESTFNRDINDILGDVMVGPAASRYGRFQQGLARVGFWMMQKVQFYGVDVPTWYGAYHQGLRKFGDEAKARAHADRMVARAQASGQFSDRSAFERGTWSQDMRQNGFTRLFTALGSYMFAKGNIAYEVYGRTRRDVTGANLKSLQAAVKGAVDMTMLFTIEAIAYNLIKGTLPAMGDDDDEGWVVFLAKETLLSMMSTVPGIRDFGSALSGFEAGAYGTVIETLSRPVVQAAQGETDMALFKALSSAAGVVTGLPSGQLNRVVDAWYRLEEGEDVSPIEFIMGRR